MARGGNSISKTAVWILLALLILGLGGFGVTSLGGGTSPVAKVGDQEVDINDYARELQNDIRAIEAQTGQPLPFAQAQELGVDRGVLGRLITTAALNHEATAMGLSIGDENLARQITQIPAFQGVDGRFDRDGYKFALDRSGLTEARFEDQLRLETARTLMQSALLRGVAMPDRFTDVVLTYIGEQRDFSWIRLDQADLTEPATAPTEDDLRTYHQGNIGKFTTPEMKKITYAWLSPEMVVDQIDIDEAQLRAEYDARADEFNVPERRLIERLGFATAQAAQEALEAIITDQTNFDALVTERGLSLSDIDMGDVAKSDLGAAGDGVFAAQSGDIVGPFDTPIGPALFRVNAILDAQFTSFEDASEMLRDELALDRARRLIETRQTDIDAMLAGGATLEELRDEAGMEVKTIEWFFDSGEGPASYEAFRQAALALTENDFPKIDQLEDGGIFAMRLDGIVEPRVLTLDEVRDDVMTLWESEQTKLRLRALADSLLPRLAEGVEFTALGYPVTQETGITRGQSILGTPPDFLDQVFALQPGDLRVIDGLGSVYVVRMDAISPPDATDPGLLALAERLVAESSQSLAQDLFRAFASDIQLRAGLTLDQAAINAVHANFQ